MVALSVIALIILMNIADPLRVSAIREIARGPCTRRGMSLTKDVIASLAGET